MDDITKEELITMDICVFLIRALLKQEIGQKEIITILHAFHEVNHALGFCIVDVLDSIYEHLPEDSIKDCNMIVKTIKNKKN